MKKTRKGEGPGKAHVRGPSGPFDDQTCEYTCSYKALGFYPSPPPRRHSSQPSSADRAPPPQTLADRSNDQGMVRARLRLRLRLCFLAWLITCCSVPRRP